MPQGVGYRGAAGLASSVAPVAKLATGFLQGRRDREDRERRIAREDEELALRREGVEFTRAGQTEDRERAAANMILKQALLISQTDPKGATELMAAEAPGNRFLQPIEFAGKSNNGWAFQWMADGTVKALNQEGAIKEFEETGQITEKNLQSIGEPTNRASASTVNDLRKQLNGLVKSRADIFQKARTGLLTEEESRRNLVGIDQRIEETQQALAAATGQPARRQAPSFGAGAGAAILSQQPPAPITVPFRPGQAPAGAASLRPPAPSPTGLTPLPTPGGEVKRDPLNLGL
jgi:hypothetical protein